MKNAIRATALLAASLLLSACGTTQTVAVGPHESISITASGENTRCDWIPRVYSGVAWNFCYLNSPYGATAGVGGDAMDNTIIGVPFFLFDFAMSAAFDTIALPWTIYTQSHYGNIEVRN
ncbi:MAG: YceK/YidQ family lipoprotein [Gammaproteobacteria bacterium]|nr:YceK/YidQ family lipoprotein [Gammaproteobacteria bacterium]